MMMPGVIFYTKAKDQDSYWYRIKKINREKGSATVVTKDGTTSIELEKLKNMAYITPDGFAGLFTVKYDGLNDVILTIHKLDNNGQCQSIPSAACRYNIIDIYHTFATKKSNDEIVIGLSMSEKTRLQNIEFSDMMQYDDLINTQIAACYKEDNVDSLLQYFNTKTPDKALRYTTENHYKKHYETVADHSKIVGLCHTVKELLETNQFMKEYHNVFDVIEVPFSLREEKFVPKKAMVDIIAEATRKIPKTIYYIPYSREIDINDIKRPYIICTADSVQSDPSDRGLYIVAYDINEEISYTDYKYGGKENLKKMLDEMWK